MKTLLLFFCILLLQNINTNAGIVHSHTHTQELSKEREADGAYSPRDHRHYSDSGEHSNEFDHEAILGSHKEAEEYDSLSPEESKRRLAILLQKMDLNNDQLISRKELKAWIIRSFKMLSEEEAKDRLEDIDEDSNGIITWNEYLLDSYGVENSSENHLNFGDDNFQLIEEDKMMWKTADFNGDGNLNSDEFIAFTHPEEDPRMLPIILEQTLKSKDLNRDNGVNFQEYIGDRGEDLSKESLLVEKTRFDNLDKDKNGKLEGSEILSWTVPSNEEIADEEVDHLFSHGDDDQDNVLSFMEILDHYESFVGSEATDYGDHLHNIHHFEDEL